MMRLLAVIFMLASACCVAELRAQCDAVTVTFANTLGEQIDGHCYTDAIVTPIGSPAGGTFSGPGIVGGQLSVVAAGLGDHPITYTVDVGGVQCEVAAIFSVINAPSFAAYSDLTQPPVYSVCVDDSPLTLIGQATTGLFGGPGVDAANSLFDPAVAGPGNHEISYFSVENGIVCESYIFLSVVGLGVYTNSSGTSGQVASDICSNYSNNFYLVGTPSGGTYINESGQSVGQQLPIGELGAGTHNYTYIVNGLDCSVEASITIVEPIEPAMLGPMDTVFCIYDAAVPLVMSAPANPPYTAAYLAGQVVDTVNPEEIYNVLGAGSHDIIMQHTEANSCSSVDTMTVYILEPPSLSFDAIPDTVCLTSGIFEDVTGSPAGGVLTGPGFTDDTFDPSGLTPGVYDYKYYFQDTLGACEDSITFDITVLTGELDVDFERTASACYTFSDTLTYSGEFGTPPLQFEWEAPLGLIEWDIGDTLVVRYEQPGYYDVTLHVTDALCRTGTITQTLDKGELQVTASPDQSIILGESADISVEAEFVLPDLVYEWEPATALSCTDCQDPIANPTETTAYIVTVTEPAGCTGMDTVVVNVISDLVGILYVPNAFTPNGDGVNDDFVVSGNAIKDYEIMIYDRFGEMVFQSNDISQNWTGEFQGTALDPGVFMYVVQVTFLDDQEDFRKGSITLIK